MKTLDSNALISIRAGAHSEVSRKLIKWNGHWKLVEIYEHFDDNGKLDAKTIITTNPFNSFEKPVEHTAFF